VAAAMAGFLDLFAIPAGTPAFRTGLLHMGLNLVITAAYAAGFLWRQALSPADTEAGEVALGPLLLSAGGLALLVVSGYLGGKLAYRYGVRVADEATQAGGFRR